MDLFACFLSNALDASFYIAITAPHFDELLMGVIGIQSVFCGYDEVTTVCARQLEFLRDSDGLVGRRFSA